MNEEDNKNRKELYTQLQIFYEDIKEKFGSLNCYEIVGVNFLCPQDASRYKDEKHEQACKPLVSYITNKIAYIIKNEV
ncbi:C-GCAxxG-C-C family (seleno)protein [endosymbiont 'TC1' of Trimyema compressum]|uniref:C-GCAxxG-C-C family (seleno)protein n=1 Tax=endosymbiont 'TC1' of Trimyema compressum TaxID=243899 RepID=UPI003CCC2A74